MSVRIVQCLCPARHALAAIPYEPGITRDQSGNVVTEQSAAELLRRMTEDTIRRKKMNPWCGICRAPAAEWRYEDAATRYETMAEALPALMRVEMENTITRRRLQHERN